MNRLASAAILLFSSVALADDAHWVALFNGKDLSNWVNVNCAPETWTVKDGVIQCTGKPTGALRTPREYENFILELEWRHLKPAGNAGVFVWASSIAAPGVPFLRAIEVQVLDNAYNVRGKKEWYTTHGDVFPIHGSTMRPIYKGSGMRCFPIEERSKSSPEWNHYRIVGQDGTIRLSVNGVEVSGGDECQWRKGYLGLESEGSPTEWRNIRIQELPSSKAGPELSAPEDEGWRSLYNGVDLRGWRADDELKKQWSGSSGKLLSNPHAGALYSKDQWGDFKLIVDARPPRGIAQPRKSASLALQTENGEIRIPLIVRAGDWTRNEVTVHGREVAVKAYEREPRVTPLPPGIPARRSIGLAGSTTHAVEFMNIYIRNAKPSDFSSKSDDS